MSYFDVDTPDLVLKSLFTKYDCDGSGKISVKELCSLLIDDLSLTEEEAETYVLLVDKDASGSLSFQEFKSWLNSGEHLSNVNDQSRFNIMRKAVEYYKKYDVDGNGGLDREEFRCLHLDLGGSSEAVDVALRELDMDHNGKISFYEFLKWLNWLDTSTF